MIREKFEHFFLMQLIIGLVILANGVFGTSPSFLDDNYIEDDKYGPGFLTVGQKYSVAIGSTVMLPCKINQTENLSIRYVLVWKRNIAILTAGNVKVTVNPRVKLITEQDIVDNNESHTSNYNLEIRDVRVTDAGDYACQIGTMEAKEIIHSLEVLVPPTINYVGPSTRLDIAKGVSIRLECRARGHPEPKIVWTRKNNLMFNGEPNITNDVLEIMHVNRHSIGVYKCTADNRVGQADSRDITLNVLYQPEIEVERPFVHTGVGYEAQLVCIVHAEPLPNVVWHKDGTQLGTTEQHSQQVRGNRYSLIIRNVTHTDLGNYTCQGSNNLGKDRAYLTLSGIPAVCVFDSPTVSNHQDQYNISWSVQSFSPIKEFRLFYRKQLAHNSQQDKSNDIIVPSYYNTFTSMSVDQWENINIPGIFIDNQIQIQIKYNPIHRMSYVIRNLLPSTNYEARVQGRNDHGWNKLSTVFYFSTQNEDLEMELSAQPALSKTIGNLELDNNYNNNTTTTIMLNSFYKKILLFSFILRIFLNKKLFKF